MDKILVLDFGSQYSHLICRRIREFSVFAELVPYDISYEEIQKHNPKGIIFSGGPSSVYNSEAPVPENKIFEMDLPLLGICYGHQLIVDKFGGKVKKANKEYGSSLLTIDNNSDFKNCNLINCTPIGLSENTNIDIFLPIEKIGILNKNYKKITTEINRLWNHEPYIKKYKYNVYIIPLLFWIFIFSLLIYFMQIDN